MPNDLVDQSSDEAAPTFTELASARYVVYRMLASVFRDPSRGQLPELSGLAKEFVDDPALVRFSFYPAWQDFLRCLVEMESALFDQAQSIYASALNDGPNAPAAWLRESHYQNPTEREQASAEIAISRRYSNAGLGVDDASLLPPDHVSVQLEFLAALCEREELSREIGDMDTATRAMRLTRAFLRRHLVWWLPCLEHRTAHVAPQSIYAFAARAANDFAVHDRDLVELTLSLHAQTERAEGQG
jgi:TorA maturation chaperone TorD